MLFGGVDTDKFHGMLQTLLVQQEKGQYVQLVITLSGLTLLSSEQSQSFHQDLLTAAFLDFGASVTRLPT